MYIFYKYINSTNINAPFHAKEEESESESDDDGGII